MSEESTDKKYSQIELELQEYKLTDKVQSKILSRAKFIFGVFLAGFTLMGFLGGSWVVKFISDKVENAVNEKIKNRTKVFSESLEKEYVKLKFKTKELDELSIQLENKINKIKDVYPQFEQLNKKYLKLTSETTLLHKQIIQTNSSLTQAVIRSSTDEPAIINADYNESKINIEGINFGDVKGKVFIRFVKIVSTEEEKIVASKWIPISGESIQKWSKDKVHIQYYQELKKEILSVRDEYTTKSKDEKQLPVAEFKIINSLGQKAEYSVLSSIFKATKAVDQLVEIMSIIQ